MAKLVDLESIASYFQTLSDPRHMRNRKHRLADNGSEFVGAALADWLPGQGVELTPVTAASPWPNGFVQSFHCRLRDEFLDGTAIEHVADAKTKAEYFRREFDEVRPHSGLDYDTPKGFSARCGEKAQLREPAGGGRA